VRPAQQWHQEQHQQRHGSCAPRSSKLEEHPCMSAASESMSLRHPEHASMLLSGLNLKNHVRPADLGSIKGQASILQSATLLMQPALLFNTIKQKHDDFPAWAAVQSRLHMRSRAANKPAGIPGEPCYSCTWRGLLQEV